MPMALFNEWHVGHRRASLGWFADSCVSINMLSLNPEYLNPVPSRNSYLSTWNITHYCWGQDCTSTVECTYTTTNTYRKPVLPVLPVLRTGQWLTVSSPYWHWVTCSWEQPPIIPTVSTPADSAKILFQRKVHLQNYLQVRNKTPPHTRHECVNVSDVESLLVTFLSSSSILIPP